ncbi:hypothetical protein ACIOVC_26210 [Pseudomonas neuropathica]|jgi:hypothetical protein|uniref:Uncharacterized protein n=1 Tax=Pseudomonas zeae TaxID=2745510 RepID=A0A9E6NPE2_9PSED|nr:hypothetical protein [Pseudomonas zeae]MDX9675723.1 hypothetical protein [Pseudomonas zeae]QXI11860.1 hypothetical protein HU754_000110 [Pseudomonas zeae]
MTDNDAAQPLKFLVGSSLNERLMEFIRGANACKGFPFDFSIPENKEINVVVDDQGTIQDLVLSDTSD